MLSVLASCGPNKLIKSTVKTEAPEDEQSTYPKTSEIQPITDQLADGTPVAIRALQPFDRSALVLGMQLLSAGSRTARFLTARASLSSAELDYLTCVDQSNHIALLAQVLGWRWLARRRRGASGASHDGSRDG
jgi:hypothetical protein